MKQEFKDDCRSLEALKTQYRSNVRAIHPIEYCVRASSKAAALLQFRSQYGEHEKITAADVQAIRGTRTQYLVKIPSKIEELLQLRFQYNEKHEELKGAMLARGRQIIKKMSELKDSGIIGNDPAIEELLNLGNEFSNADFPVDMKEEYEQLARSLFRMHRNQQVLRENTGWDACAGEALAEKLLAELDNPQSDILSKPEHQALRSHYEQLMSCVEALLYKVQHRRECFTDSKDEWREPLYRTPALGDEAYHAVLERLNLICTSTRDLLFTKRMTPETYNAIAKQLAESDSNGSLKMWLGVSVAMLALCAAALALGIVLSTLPATAGALLVVFGLFGTAAAGSGSVAFATMLANRPPHKDITNESMKAIAEHEADLNIPNANEFSVFT